MDKKLLNKMFDFHGHKYWASALGLRAGLFALEKLGVKRSNVKELFVVLETGYNHGAGCFDDGVRFATGCTEGQDCKLKFYEEKSDRSSSNRNFCWGSYGSCRACT